MLSEEARLRLAKEYRYAVTKMLEAPQPEKKLYYFSVFFGEAQRILNMEWDRDLSLIYLVAHHVHTQVLATMQNPGALGLFPIDWKMTIEKLTQASSNLAVYYEKSENEDTRKEMYHTLGTLAEIVYIISGNGSYLYEKGCIKF